MLEKYQFNSPNNGNLKLNKFKHLLYQKIHYNSSTFKERLLWETLLNW